MTLANIATMVLAVIGGMTAVVLVAMYIANLGAGISKLGEKIDSLAKDISQIAHYVRDLGDRTAKLEGRVDEISRNAPSAPKAEDESPPRN